MCLASMIFTKDLIRQNPGMVCVIIEPELAKMAVVRPDNRLSIMPVSAE